MDAFSSGFVVGALSALVLVGATLGVVVWAALHPESDMSPDEDLY